MTCVNKHENWLTVCSLKRGLEVAKLACSHNLVAEAPAEDHQGGITSARNLVTPSNLIVVAVKIRK
jgi:hypothetical protein